MLGAFGVAAAAAAEAGQDLQLYYVSSVDQTQQPYRLYVPSSYDGTSDFPLIIAMHGTGGDESTLFDAERYSQGAIKKAAEEYKALLASPLGRGVTEYRGIGENDIFCVLEDNKRHYRVDEDRIYLTGHSMGGTGAAYLALHHPDLFAAAAPLAAAYSFPWLARNAAHVPFLWIGGAEDLEFYLRGVAAGVERMRKFAVPVRVELFPGEDHYGPVKDFGRVFRWLLKHKRNAHPTQFAFEIDTPFHGRAYRASVHRMAEPGKMALIRAEAQTPGRALFLTENIAEFSFEPDPVVFDLSRSLEVVVHGEVVYQGAVPAAQALRIVKGSSGWTGSLEQKQSDSLISFRNHPVATAPETLDMEGTEKRLANWIADAMRHATGADIALYNAYAYRGLPIEAGTVDIVDLIQCSRPFDQYLVTAELSGADLIEILEDNLPDAKRDRKNRIDQPGAGQWIQLSGARYEYDPEKPQGQRIVSTSLEKGRLYSVVMEGQAVERETIRLAGRFKNLDYQTTDIAFTLALYGYAAQKGSMEAKREGRVARADEKASR
jgi:predicted esterase